MTRQQPSANFILFALAFGVFVAADDLTVVSTMLLQIALDLEIPLPNELDRVAWIVNAYLIAYVVVMPFIGRLSDIIGRKRVYTASLLLFLIGSIWVIVPFNSLTGGLISPSFNFFLIGRVLSALGGGAMVPVSMAIVADIYAEKKRASALGILAAVDTLGWVWGPLYGAFLVRYLSWEWQFYLNVPLTLLGIALAWYGLRGLDEPQHKPRIDWLGAILLTVSLLAFNIALLNSGDLSTAGGFDGFDAPEKPSTIPLYITAAVTFALFVYTQRRPQNKTPLIDLGLFKLPNFTPAILINFIIGGTLIIVMVNVPIIVNVIEQSDVGQAALLSGYLLSSMTGTMALTSYLGGKLTERASYRWPTLLGLGACLAAFLMLGFVWMASTPLVNMGLHLALLGAGFGFVTAPIGAAVINAAPAHDSGIASSLVIVMRLIGMSVGLSALTAWGLRRFGVLRNRLELPTFGSADYYTALNEALVNITVTTLTETFAISAGLIVLAIFIASRLKK